MNSYLVSARKYRPNNFKDVIGQNHITESLENSIKSNTISHAYIFCGPRGVGKTTCARIFAKQLNKDKDLQKNDFSFNIFELDAASNNSVDDIRDLVNQVKIPPQIGNYKVYIIDEAHMLSKSAFNAFLKTLEEPPKHCVFILATTEKEKIIPTILSRCQIFDFKRISEDDISNYLALITDKENIQTDNENITLIAKNADGALRDALSLFDKVHSFCGQNWEKEKVLETLNSLDQEKIALFVNKIQEENMAQILVDFDLILKNGFEGDSLVSGLIEYYRNVMMCKDPVSLSLLTTPNRLKKDIEKLSAFYSTNQIIQILHILSECQKDYNQTTNKRFLVELCLMQLCSINEKKNLKKKIKIPQKQKVNSGSEEKTITNNEKNDSVSKKSENSVEYPVIEDKKTSKENVERIEKRSLLGTATIEDVLTNNISEKKDILIEENKEEKFHTKFSESELLKSMNDFCLFLEKKKKINLRSTLKANQPQLINEHIVLFKLNSNSQKKEILEMKIELLGFLKKELKNDFIEIKIELTKKETKELLYTDQEKLNYMVKKNPELKNMVESLDLEFLN